MAVSQQFAAGALSAGGVSGEALADFRSGLRGHHFCPGEPGYEDGRAVWNGMVDKRPALIVRCAGVSDVLRTLTFARERRLPVAVRGGGHNVAGHAVCDGGVVIDFSHMKSIRVDPQRRTARAEPGVTWGEFDRETQAFGLATTGGLVSTTGIAGLTLGGGVGWLVRKHGLACDNLISADVITADGTFWTASAEQNADLFWALRGGGGNLGVVTSLKYRLHPVGPVVGGMLLHPIDDAKQVLAFYRDFAPTAPDDLTLYCGLLSAPDGAPVVALIGCYSGPPGSADAVLAPVRGFGSPIADLFQETSYCAMQSLLDAAFPAGMRYHWKSSFIDRLPAEAIDRIVEAAAAKTSPLSSVVLEYYGGAASRVPEDATAFPHRVPQFDLIISAQWADPAEDQTHVTWVRRTWESMRPFSSGRVYVNVIDEGEDRVREAFGVNYERLASLKSKYDPDNLFRFNQNVAPATVSG